MITMMMIIHMLEVMSDFRDNFFCADCEKCRLENRIHSRRKEVRWMQNAPTEVTHIAAGIHIVFVSMTMDSVPHGNGRHKLGCLRRCVSGGRYTLIFLDHASSLVGPRVDRDRCRRIDSVRQVCHRIVHVTSSNTITTQL